MEARVFLEKWKKMCKKHPQCLGCPLYENRDCYRNIEDFKVDKIVDTVESWNPRTNKDALLEKYPRAILMDGGTPKACPKNLDSDYDCSIYTSCMKCREEYWNGTIE